MSLIEDWQSMGSITRLWSAALVGFAIMWFIMFMLEKVYGQKLVVGEMTLEELDEEVKLTGRSLVGCMGKVYDVGANPSYTDGGDLQHLVGKDASVALAKMKLDPEFECENLHWSRDLNEAEYSILKDWAKKLEEKHDVVALIKEEEKKLKKV